MFLWEKWVSKRTRWGLGTRLHLLSETTAEVDANSRHGADLAIASGAAIRVDDDGLGSIKGFLSLMSGLRSPGFPSFPRALRYRSDGNDLHLVSLVHLRYLDGSGRGLATPLAHEILGLGVGLELFVLGVLPAHDFLLGNGPIRVDAGGATDCDAVELGGF